MTIVGEDCTDIMLDENGQPVADENGEFKTVRGDECWEQDLRLETQTEEGELFYEDEDGDEAYGFGFLDFAHGEDDELTRMEIGQRVRDKLAKRKYLDQRKTMQNISFENGVFIDQISVAKQDSKEEYNIELSTNEVEVETE